jgi:CheY-like chemotaxis protein
MMGRCVLAIEHDWRIRKLIRANLEAVGLVVREAVSEQHGLQLLGGPA